MRIAIAWPTAFVVLAVAFCARGVAAEEPVKGAKAPAAMTFEQDILPILKSHCIQCHGEGKLEGGLDLRRRALLVKGGESGPAIVPGKPDQSLLAEKLRMREMPPKPRKRLDAAHEQRIREWIAAGAPTTTIESTSQTREPAPRIADADRRFWAFQPPAQTKIPKVRAGDRVRTPIDAFLLARLEEKGLSFNPDAPKEVLLRRASLDLIGLPPAPDEVDRFLADDSPDAYERAIDGLLASPAYGERWARHWLDVAGYADSDGYLAADRERSEAWRYRDYVIEAHNDDLPFDRFLLEQLAGDELSDWRTADRLPPEMIRQLTATGFLRTCLDPTYPTYTEPNEIHQVISDTMQIVGSAFLGLTIQCARCHAHKYDPISQRDYYALQAVFLPALDPARWQPSGLRGIPLAGDSDRKRVEERNRDVDRQIAPLQAALGELTARYRRKRVAELVTEAVARRGADAASPKTTADRQIVEQIVAALEVKKNKRSGAQRRLIAQYLPGGNVAVKDAELSTRYPQFKTESETLKAAIAAANAGRLSITLLRGLADLGGPPPTGRILIRGDYNHPGGAVDPGVPAVLAGKSFRFEPKPRAKSSGRRTALARWLIDPSHPLTARVQVNRIWSRHFGRGLVATTDNFGHSGTRPTHPDLLDWLAREFVDCGWSMKAIHRRVVTSSAYRQSDALAADQQAADPDNLLLGAWQPRRFEGEVLRDSVLAVTGDLNRRMLGPPSAVLPQPDGSVLTETNPSGKRRSIYLKVRRSQHLTMLDLFDTPVMEINCPQRCVSIVPLQALAMLHGPFAEQSAAALAQRIRSAATTDDGRLELACRLLYARGPTERERQAVLAFLDRMAERSPAARAAGTESGTDFAAWTQVALVLLNSDAFMYVE